VPLVGKVAIVTGAGRERASDEATISNRGLPRQFWLLVGAVFIFLVGVQMCLPYEGLFMHRRLGVSITVVGLTIGSAAFVGLPMQVLAGALADRFGRRLVLLAGACGSIALYFGLAVASTLWQVVVVLVIEAASGWGMFLTGSSTMVADLVPPERRSEAFGLVRIASYAGIILGPIAAGALFRIDESFRLQFAAGGIVSSTYLGFVLVLIRETKPESGSPHRLATSVKGYAVVLRDARFVAFCAISLLPLYCFGQFWSIFPFILRDVLGLSPASWGRLLALFAVTGIVLVYPVTRFTATWDNLILMAVGSALIGGGIAGATLGVGGAGLVLMVVLISLGVILFIPVSSTVITCLAPLELRGRYVAVWMVVWLGGYALGPLLGGFALDRLGGRGAGLLLLASGLSGAALYSLMMGGRGSHAPASVPECAIEIK
jgi:MFS family permease